jgi:hypothetical protein
MFTRPELELQTYEDLVALRDAKLPPQVYVIATGGCSQMQSTLWKLPGASAFLVGAEFPYNVGATHELLGYMPKKFISPETAMALAEAAYLRALGSMTDGPRVGLGITCSVATTREHRGDHRICAAAISDTQAVYCTHILQKGVGQKQREYDDLIAEILAFKCLFAVTLKKDFVRTPEGFYLEDGHDLDLLVRLAIVCLILWLLASGPSSSLSSSLVRSIPFMKGMRLWRTKQNA